MKLHSSLTKNGIGSLLKLLSSPQTAWQHFQRRIATVDALPQLTLLGAVIGIASGLLIVVFRLAIELPLDLILQGHSDHFEGLSTWARFGLPILGALVLGLWMAKRSSTARAVGISHVLDRLNNHQGNLPESNAWYQAGGAIIACISGQSTGREGPAVHLGAAIASSLGQRLALPKNRMRTLVGCGVAGAISASFNIPLAGVIFALEVVLKEYTVAGFIPILMSATLAALLTSHVFGAEPAFNIPATDHVVFGDMLYVAFVSVCVGALAAGFNKLSIHFAQLSPADPKIALLILGVATGTLGCLLPEIMGIGYDSIHQMVSTPWSIGFLLLFLTAKLVVTAMACGFGLPGGIIGPILILGTASGVIFGSLAQSVLPESAASLGFYALMGMGAMMAGVLQAPLAALVALLEMTQNPSLLMPAMLAVVISSMMASEAFNRRSIFVELLAERGISLEQHPTLHLLRNTAVTSLMKQNYIQVPSKLHLSEITPLLDKDPKWLLLCTQYPHYVLIPAIDLARIINDEQLLNDYIDHESQTLDLTQIPAQRLSAQSLSHRAHLEDALQLMTEQQIDAVTIEANWTHLQEPIGVLLLDQINHYYQFSPRTQHAAVD